MKSDAPRVVAPQSIEARYRLLGATRPSFAADETRALAYYSPLFEFISGLVPAGADRESARLLDVGCGSGWSTYGFAALLGYDATGIDVNASAFEPPSHERCTLVVGEATAIPYRDESFDVVACFQTLEHVPAPATALDEMIRVCRARGVIAIVGPNLMSPFPGLAYWAWPSRW